MTVRARLLVAALMAAIFAGPCVLGWADDSKPAAAKETTDKSDPKKAEPGDSGAKAEGKTGGSDAPAPKPKYPPFPLILKDAKQVNGLLTLHKREQALFAELTPAHLNRDFIIVISIAKGIGKGPLYGGMSWGFGDDWIWQFRKVDDQIHIVRRNVRFTATKGSPEDKAVGLAYTDSVLYSLPIATIGPNGGMIVDLTPVFMSDLPQISRVLPGFQFSPSKSTWASVKGFPDNSELQVAATYASGGGAEIDTIADSRGATINVHYSISALPQTGYRPRLADDRVGYFLTVVKDFSKKTDDDRYVRYINRWDLAKADASAELSPPKKPIIFWLEKTIPYKYRKPIRDGILEWNKAYEKAGFVNAVEVRQQPDNADWDPEDINYNTFRWITSSSGFAMGPSRVNPLTGQILDADIIFDADFLQHWKQEYETFTPKSIADLTGGPLTIEEWQKEAQTHGHKLFERCNLADGLSRELAFASTVMMANPGKSEAEVERMIVEGLKEVTMHEVGHTLGLRHNFKASAWLTLDQMNDQAKTRETGLTASVMDYTPAHIVPKGVKQGDFFSGTIGPYDMWAIEYGYKTTAGGSPESELPELKKIAARSGDPTLMYATDEDTRGIDPDPLVNRFDLGKDPIEFAKQRAKLIADMWPDLIDKVTKDGDGYQRVRQAFGVLLGNYGQAMHFASRYVGGIYVNRSHKGDEKAAEPFVVVEAKKQREALEMLEKNVFNDEPFKFPPKLYNHLAASRWNHWGVDMPPRTDYAVHDILLMWQSRILAQLLSSTTLNRLHDSELRLPADQDAFTAAELIDRLTKAIFAETDKLQPGEYTNRKPAISSLRRNLQRAYLRNLSDLALGDSNAPHDCQTIAYSQLSALGDRVKKTLNANIKLDDYSKAHLEETAARIQKILDAKVSLSRP